MSQWVRLWEDMPTDPKWRVVARRAGRPLPEVLAVFVFMLTNASKAQERGTLANWNDEDVGAAIDVDAEHIAAIREAMQGKTLDGDRLTGWERRQPKREDGAAERAKEWRERNRTQPNAPKQEANAQKRPDTDTDTEQKQKDARAPAKSSFEQECRTLVGEEPVLVSLDFHKLQKLVDDGAVTEADVKAGISAAMAKPDFRIRHWSQLEGWARGAAKERLAGKSKTGPPVVVAMTPEDRAAAVAKVGKRWVEYDTAEWSRVADLYKAATGKFPPHPAGGWYFPESYFQKSECAA